MSQNCCWLMEKLKWDLEQTNKENFKVIAIFCLAAVTVR